MTIQAGNDGHRERLRARFAGTLGAQFEHSVAVTEDGVEILTESPMGYTFPPYL